MPRASASAGTLGLLSAVALAATLHAQQPSNLGFEAHSLNGGLVGWGAAGAGFEIVVDSVAPLAGRFSLRTRWLDAAAHPEPGKFAVASQPFPVAAAAGRMLHLTGYIRTENLRAGYAGFWMRVDGPNGSMLAFDKR